MCFSLGPSNNQTSGFSEPQRGFTNAKIPQYWDAKIQGSTTTDILTEVETHILNPTEFAPKSFWKVSSPVPGERGAFPILGVELLCAAI